MGKEDKHEEAFVHHIASAIRDIKYGSVQIIIQDSRIIQIEKTEKIRVKEKEVMK